jgi:hypothetical protein
MSSTNGRDLGNAENNDLPRQFRPDTADFDLRRGAPQSRHGMRQSLELFLTPVTRDLTLSAADFALAVAIQNIVWGVLQAPIGTIADRFGLRAFCEGLHPDVEQHLQQPSFRGRLARQVAADRC